MNRPPPLTTPPPPPPTDRQPATQNIECAKQVELFHHTRAHTHPFYARSVRKASWKTPTPCSPPDANADGRRRHVSECAPRRCRCACDITAHATHTHTQKECQPVVGWPPPPVWPTQTRVSVAKGAGYSYYNTPLTLNALRGRQATGDTLFLEKCRRICVHTHTHMRTIIKHAEHSKSHTDMFSSLFTPLFFCMLVCALVWSCSTPHTAHTHSHTTRTCVAFIRVRKHSRTHISLAVCVCCAFEYSLFV